jgi:hypothetical protein
MPLPVGEADSMNNRSHTFNSEGETVWAFDLGKGSIGEAVRQGNRFLHKASLSGQADANRRRLIAAITGNKKGAAKAPVQELRLTASLLSLPTVWNTGHRRF